MQAKIKKGFTLIEILLVITLLAILMGIVVLAINPRNLISEVNDNKREADALVIYQALEQYALKNNTYPESIKNMPNNSSAYICKTSAPNCTNFNQINLSTILVPTYLSKIPEYSTDTNNSGFYVVKDSNGKIGIGGIRRLDDTTFVKGLESQSFATAPTTPKLAVTSCTYADKKISISYKSGEVGYNYASQTINSTGVTGLTATLTSGTLLAIDGILDYVVTGTPSGGGTANFDIGNIGNMGVSCNNSNIAVNVTETVLDSNYNNVSLLINGNGTNGSTSITDSSSNSNTVTAFGNSQISNVQSKFGGSSVYFDGSGDYLRIPVSDVMGFGSGDYTVEAWVYGNWPSYSTIFDNRTGGSQGVGFYTGQNNRITVANNSAVIIETGSIPVNTWTHVAISRQSNVLRAFINGVKIGEVTDSRVYGTSAEAYIGANGGLFQTFAGYMDDLRVTKGVARYNSNFTPTTTEFPTSGNTLTY